MSTDEPKPPPPPPAAAAAAAGAAPWQPLPVVVAAAGSPPPSTHTHIPNRWMRRKFHGRLPRQARDRDTRRFAKTGSGWPHTKNVDDDKQNAPLVTKAAVAAEPDRQTQLRVRQALAPRLDLSQAAPAPRMDLIRPNYLPSPTERRQVPARMPAATWHRHAAQADTWHRQTRGTDTRQKRSAR